MDALDMDFAACAEAVDAAACEEGVSGDPGLVLPEECLGLTEF